MIRYAIIYALMFVIAFGVNQINRTMDATVKAIQKNYILLPRDGGNWECTLKNAKHPIGQSDPCVQYTKEGF